MKASFILKMFLITFISLIVSSPWVTGEDAVKTPGEAAPTSQWVKKTTPSYIQTISFQEEEKTTRIHIEGDQTLPPPTYKLSQEPLKIVLDLPGIDLHRVRSPLKIDNGTVTEVTTTQYDEKGRIEIGLLQMTHFNIFREDKSLFIDIEKVTSFSKREKKDLFSETSKSLTLTPEKMPKAKEIIDVFMEKKNDHISFNILTDGKVENYNLYKLDVPPRLVLDIWEVSTRYPKKSIRVSNPYVKEVRIGQHQNKLRLVFHSSKPQLPSYQINRLEDRLIVSLGKVPQPSEPQIYVQEKGLEELATPKLQLASSTPSPATKEKTPAASAEALPKPARAKIALKEADFKQIDDKSRIALTLSGDPQFETYRVSEKVIAIDIRNAFAPKHLLREINTSAFDSAVNSIEIKNVKNDLRVLLKLREETPYETTKEGQRLFFDIQKPKRVVTKIEAPPLPPKPPQEAPPKEERRVEDKREPVRPVLEVTKEERAGETPAEKVIQKPIEKPTLSEGKQPAEGVGLERIYTGRKISLDFKDADIKNILRLIAEVSNFNIITADDVSGRITMRLVDVPWDQALDVILQARNLGKVQIGNVIRIAPIETLRRETQARLEEKRATERLEDTVTELIPVNYATAKDIIPQVKGVLSERGEVKVDERTNTLIIKDTPKNILSVKSLVKSLDTKTPQILIEARIVEASLAFQRDLGISWGFLASGGDKKMVDVGGGTSATSTLPGTPVPTNRVVNLPALVPPGGSGSVSILEFLFRSDYGLRQLDIAISAYENKGDAHVISSPKIATLNNIEASIEQGLRIPYTKITTEGTATEDFIDANLKLTVTPQVTNDGHIKLKIKVKKDAPDYGEKSAFGTPRIDKKEAITEVLVKDNGVAAIAGIYTIEKSDGTTGVPLFSKIPLLGWLFKKETKTEGKKDLLIFISPKILRDET